MKRNILVRPDQLLETPNGQIACVSREALTAAFLDMASVVHVCGGHWEVVTERAATGVPGESLTVGAMCRWIDHTGNADRATPERVVNPTPPAPAPPAPVAAAPAAAAVPDPRELIGQLASQVPAAPPPPAPSPPPFTHDAPLPPGQDPAYVAQVPLPDAAGGEPYEEEDTTSLDQALRSA